MNALFEQAWEGIRHGVEAGRMAHAYLLAGSPRGTGKRFAERFLQLLFCKAEAGERPCGVCPACRQVTAHAHVDVLWVEPQSKSREIRIDDVRQLIHQMSRTAFEGGWKAGVILAADRMNVSAQNALLKTLEEPPPQSVLLLVSDSPQALLDTILSRCQRINLPKGGEEEDAAAGWMPALEAILHRLPPESGLQAARLAMELKALFDDLRAEMEAGIAEEMDEVADEQRRKQILEARLQARMKEAQGQVFRRMLEWFRAVLAVGSGGEEMPEAFPDAEETVRAQARRLGPDATLRALQAVEEMSRRLDRNMPPAQVFDEGFRRIAEAARSAVTS